MPFVCIYCRKSPPDVMPSEAHLFAYALGGTVSSRDIVCAGCNGYINRELETPALPGFRIFQSLHGIEGRRGRVPGLPATARVEGLESGTTLGADGKPKRPIVHETTNEQGKKSFAVYGHRDEIQAVIDNITRAHSEIKWSESRYDVAVEVVIDGPAVGSPLLRRLAAKVAFERLAQLRGAVTAVDSEFDCVRAFILTGDEAQPTCGITADPLLLKGSFSFPVPAHAVVVVFHEEDRVLGAFVMFFGLFLYWVILSRRYRALGSVDELLVEWPHIRESSRPLLRTAVGAIRVPWSRYVQEYTSDPVGTGSKAVQAASGKFKAALEDIWMRPPEVPEE